MDSRQKMHPWLEGMVRGKDELTLKALEDVITILEKLSNKPQPPEIRVSLGVKEMEAVAKDAEAAVQSLNQTLEQNTASFENFKQLLTGLPAMLKNLQTMLSELRFQLTRPVQVQLDAPPPAPVPEPVVTEVPSSWNSLKVDVTERNRNGNIQQVRISKET